MFGGTTLDFIYIFFVGKSQRVRFLFFLRDVGGLYFVVKYSCWIGLIEELWTFC